MYVRLNGEMVYLWRAVDHEGEVLESYVTKTRDKSAALRFIRKALKRHGHPAEIVTDGLRSYVAALKELHAGHLRRSGRWVNNRAKNSHLPFRRREAAMQGFRSMQSLQKFVSVHASVCSHFNIDGHLVSRSIYKLRRAAAQTAWGFIAS
jgi:putative transposase